MGSSPAVHQADAKQLEELFGMVKEGQDKVAEAAVAAGSEAQQEEPPKFPWLFLWFSYGFRKICSL